jgi:peptidoglycan/LPS O-acetylase OafA/YrhL
VAGARFGILTKERILGAALQYTVAHIFFSGMLLFFLLVGSSARKWLVNIPALQFLGYISYGLYLIHLLVFRIYDRASMHFWPQFLPVDGRFSPVVVRFLVSVSAAVGIAYISRRYFEEFFLRLKDRVGQDRGNVPLVNSASETVQAISTLQNPAR